MARRIFDLLFRAQEASGHWGNILFWELLSQLLADGIFVCFSRPCIDSMDSIDSQKATVYIRVHEFVYFFQSGRGRHTHAQIKQWLDHCDSDERES